MTKKILGCVSVCAILLLCAQMRADEPTPIPNCWNNPNATVRDYLIGINLAEMGSAKSIEAMEAFSHTRYVHPTGYPLFFDYMIYVDVNVPLNQVSHGAPLTEAELRAAAEAELSQLARDFRITIDCNGRVRPQ